MSTEQEASADLGTGTPQLRMHRLLAVRSVALRPLAACPRERMPKFHQHLVPALTGSPALPESRQGNNEDTMGRQARSQIPSHK